MKNARDSGYYKNNSDCTYMCGYCVVLQVWMTNMQNLTYESCQVENFHKTMWFTLLIFSQMQGLFESVVVPEAWALPG